MTDIIKKHKEYLILKKLYNKEGLNIEPSESPDFVIESSDDRFGVEITEYYYNESSARLKNYKGYSEKILKSDSSKILDKRDKGFITKTSLFIKDPKDCEYKFLMNTIQLKYNDNYDMGEAPQFKDVENQILDIIETKNKKSFNYKKCVSYIELFINDKEDFIEKHIHELNDSIRILNKVNKSRFKRVYFFFIMPPAILIIFHHFWTYIYLH